MAAHAALTSHHLLRSWLHFTLIIFVQRALMPPDYVNKRWFNERLRISCFNNAIWAKILSFWKVQISVLSQIFFVDKSRIFDQNMQLVSFIVWSFSTLIIKENYITVLAKPPVFLLFFIALSLFPLDLISPYLWLFTLCPLFSYHSQFLVQFSV